MNNVKLEICFLSTDSLYRNKISEMLENYFVVYDEEGKKEFIGVSRESKDVNNLYRFLCYKLQLDNLSKKTFTKSFKETIRQLEKTLDKLIISIGNTVSVYGEVTRDNPVFVPKHYEYKKYIPLKVFGNINESNLLPNKNIVSATDVVHFDGSIILGDINTLKNRSEVYINKMVNGLYNIYKIYDHNNKLAFICLVHNFKDLYALHWEEHFAFCTDHSDNAAMYLCKPDYIITKKDVPTEDYLIHTDGNFFAVKVNNMMNKNDGSKNLAQVYVARDTELDAGRIVGLAFEVMGREFDSEQTLYDFL